jgi:hypothetical protein
MNERFEAALDECLQALRDGSADVASCLRRYPDLAAELHPHLDLASKLMQTYEAATPSEEFSTRARARFLVASGQRLTEAFDVDPSPSFFAVARVRFLMAAHNALGGNRESAPARGPRFPVFGTAYRALAASGAALVLLLGLSSYTVAEASDALPGDRLYGVKLQTERVRLALAFTEGAERDVRLDIASERVEEIEQLTAKGRIIGPGVIERLQNETEPLAAGLDSFDKDEKQRVLDLASKAEGALKQAEGQVDPAAQPVLAQVHEFVEETAFKAAVAIINDSAAGGPPPVITPNNPVESPEPTNTPEPTETPDASATPQSTTPQPSATPARDGVVVGPSPVGVDIGITWVRVAVGRFTTLIPSPQDGWSIAGVNPDLGTSTTPNIVTITNVDGTQIITMNPRNGDLYWFVSLGGAWDEVRLREQRGGQTFVIDRELLTGLYGPLANVPLYILDHIEIAPRATPVPTSTQTPAIPPVAPAP